MTGRSVSPIIVAVLHDVVRAAVAVLVTSPASTRAVRLPTGRPGAGVTVGRLPSQRVLVHLGYRVGDAAVGGLRGVNRIRTPDVVAEPADSVPRSKDTDVAQAKSERKILQILVAIKDGVLQIPPVVRGGQVGDVGLAVAAPLEQEP